jgi:tRNA(adenine34) deaminase
MIDVCEVCNKPLRECTCCPECGHTCGLDYGELYCPVCLPDPLPQSDTSKIHVDEHFMRLALKEAEKALRQDEVPVGAVLVRGKEIIAAAHNRKKAGNDPTAHAELLVIKEGAVKIKNWRLTEAAIYVTKEPCVMCAGGMVNARLGRLVYGCKDSRYGAITSQYQIGSDSRLNHRLKVTAGVLEKDCSDIIRNFFVKLR